MFSHQSIEFKVFNSKLGFCYAFFQYNANRKSYNPSDSELEEEVNLQEPEFSMHLEGANPSSHEEAAARFPLSSYKFTESAMA